MSAADLQSVPRSDEAERLGETTLALCRIDSVIGQEQALADHLERWAQPLFPAAERFRHSHSLVLGNLADPRPTVALVGHIDTVPPAARPNPVRREGDRLFGLGVSDMKGGLAVMMRLAETLPRAQLALNVLWIFYEREEGPYAENGLEPLFAQLPALKRLRFAIALEPTDGEVQVGCVGSLHATVRFHGKAAHSARPWQGENAVQKAGALLAKLHALPRREVEQSGFKYYEVVSVTKAQGGRARNVVPDLFELNLNYRFAPGKSLETAQADLRALVATSGDDAAPEITFTDLSPSGRVCADNPLFTALVARTQKPATPKQAWTDVARFSLHGVDAVNLGPGETAQAHQETESASQSALGVAYHQLSEFLRHA